MKALLKWGLWQRRWSIIWWSVGIMVFIFINLIFYPSFKSQASQYEKLFSQIPDTAKTMLTDTGDFLSPEGYLSSQVYYLMLPMLLGILVISLGSSLIGREEKEGTIELLLGRPISRSKLITAKALIGLVILISVGLIGSFMVGVMAKYVDLAVPSISILLAGLACLLLVLSFGAVAFMVTTLGRGARAAAISVAAIYAIAGYLLVSLSSAVAWLSWPSKFFPFYYYRPGEILQNQYQWYNLLVILLIIVVCGFISWRSFRRRDLGV